MMPLSEQEIAGYDFSSHALVIPEHLIDSLIGEQIVGTELYKSFPEDPTKSGYTMLHGGTPMESKVYKTLHTPTGSKIQYRKLNSLVYGDVWEVVPTEGA